jgi:hypothetical protein
MITTRVAIYVKAFAIHEHEQYKTTLIIIIIIIILLIQYYYMVSLGDMWAQMEFIFV